jgi:hypothetical protein
LFCLDPTVDSAQVGLARPPSPFPQALLPIPGEGREQIADNSA